jgi:triacylglycerol lipase
MMFRMCALFLVGMISGGSVLASTYTATKYPIVLLTGLGGLPNAMGTLPMEYFYGIDASLERSGARVWTVPMSPANTDYVRGEQVIKYIEDVVLPAEWAQGRTWVDRVNLIGHSQGGFAGRYVAGIRPDLVASLTSIGTPHNRPTSGLDLSDVLFNENISIAGITGSDIVETIFSVFGDLSVWLSGGSQPNDAKALAEFARARFDEFNVEFPQGLPLENSCDSGGSIVNGVRYFSMSGTSTLTTGIDPSDGLLVLLGAVMDVDDANDGAVGRCQSHMGKVIRDNYLMNHFDENNGLYGLVYPFATNPKTMYRKHANHLKNIGL